MIFKLLTEQHLETLSLKGSCTGSQSPLVKMSNCWKSHATTQILLNKNIFDIDLGLKGTASDWWYKYGNCCKTVLRKKNDHLVGGISMQPFIAIVIISVDLQ